MNERIKELALKAGSSLNQYDMYEFTDIDLDQFVHMIVQECIQAVKDQYEPVLEDAVMMRDTHWDGYVQCGVDSVVSIREHFYGVKE